MTLFSGRCLRRSIKIRKGKGESNEAEETRTCGPLSCTGPLSGRLRQQRLYGHCLDLGIRDGVYRTLDEIKADGTINIGVFSDKNPFGYVDENGEYQAMTSTLPTAWPEDLASR